MRPEDAEEERFQAAIKHSNRATIAAIAWLFNNTSWWILAKPAVARPTGANPSTENTPADVFVSKTGGDPWRRIEVKHRGNLSGAWSAESYPFPTIFLDRVKPQPIPDFYFIINREFSHMAIIPASTKERWQISTVNDRGKAGNPYQVRECPKDLPEIRWITL